MVRITLELPDDLTRRARQEAERRGLPLDRLVELLIEEQIVSSRPPADSKNDDAGDMASSSGPTDETRNRKRIANWEANLPPITRSLLGCIKDSGVSKEDYYRYLEEKHR